LLIACADANALKSVCLSVLRKVFVFEEP